MVAELNAQEGNLVKEKKSPPKVINCIILSAVREQQVYLLPLNI